ncbi:hypothetical protein BVI2075_50076 [Burkholderia vietnamiensis]|nr:hypothetical protein BVI2075_50076 [Burkholderia vietnamiensis]
MRADRIAHAPAGGSGAAVSRVARRGERAPAATRHARVCRDRWRVGARCRRGARQAGAADRGAGRMGGVSGRLCRGRRKRVPRTRAGPRARRDGGGRVSGAAGAQRRRFSLGRRRRELARAGRGRLNGTARRNRMQFGV